MLNSRRAAVLKLGRTGSAATEIRGRLKYRGVVFFMGLAVYWGCGVFFIVLSLCQSIVLFVSHTSK